MLQSDCPMSERSVPVGTHLVSFMPPEESELGSKSNFKRKKMKAMLLLKVNHCRSMRI